MELSNKAAYIKGLIDGLKIDDSTPEGKVIIAMAELLEEMSGTVEDIAAEVDETVDVIDGLHEDLSDLEDVVFSDYEDTYDNDEDYDDDEPLDEELYECVCPTCGDTICLSEELIANGSIDCPNCGESLEFDFSDIEEEEE